ncbi:MAG: DUF4357 domain-containing protein [Cetobacterium sp.]
MEAKQRKIIDLFSEPNTQFTIPVYQRDYNWEEKQCQILLNDIISLAKNNDIISHFVGSIVYIHEGVYTLGVKELNIIDGQQRMTTLTLLFLAICHSFKKLNSFTLFKKTFNRYIIDEYMDKDIQSKLIPPEENLNLLQNIINENDSEIEKSKDRNMVKNYRFFFESLKNFTEDELKEITVGIEKLIYVDIALEKGKDDPQKIFESLNSTGLDLSQSDLIRNYILMDLERDEQNKIYKNIWIPIENNCKISDGSKIISYVSSFIRDYLTLKNNNIPNKAKVFQIFKEFYLKNSCILEDVKQYSECYALILKPNEEKDKEVKKRLKYLAALDQTVLNPFLMGILKDYKEKIVSKKEFIKVLNLLESYIWRRYITGEPSNALNKIFMSLYSKIDKNNYYNSFAKIIIKLNFPTDEDLKSELKIKPVYKDRSKINYIFEKLENYYHNELIDFENDKITIEHIFPQKPSNGWYDSLDDEEFEQMLSLKNTISNLTLTGSNSNLGNRTFLDKRDDEQHGYKNSKLYLNKWLGQQDKWNVLKLSERFENIFEDILNIWYRPILENESEDKDEIFFIKGLRASGSGKFKSNSFLVLKDSVASKNQTVGIGVRNLKTIEKLLSLNVLKEDNDKYIFEKDYLFSSPSAAATLILGRAANGWTEWKTFDGKLLDCFRIKGE